MKNFIKLTNFEINRMSKVLFSLMAFMLVVQIGGVIYESLDYLNRVEERMMEQQLTRAEVLDSIGPMSFHPIINGIFFIGPIFICVGAILFYIFLIWYRDWFGKNTFIYRLLMLPTERINIYLSKLAAIVMATLSLVAFQLMAILVERFVFQMMVPDDLRTDDSITNLIVNSMTGQLFIPNGFDAFLLIYGVGVMTVMVLFTMILFERSYRFKGIAFGVLYGLLSVALFISPMILNELFLDKYFYLNELVWIEVIVGLIIMAVSTWVSFKLLKDKINV
ncbi:hypothetical protein [Tenuibacillus multivorans]|uniref:ABC-2 family transporter protein n=1 Tax=Tenuibacillus multivorans TaxID=237069 RepID=A0A1H0ECB2_9BACI|nr:hypothetical protein [Tenuibacillus multivorans]GEL77217.1 hypothetical protein TMU01_14520 [Tenuibacillus multivorans]SDN79978.1 hypothetical protein SAMN05216498_3095 [Tenuibacillus multivorans]